MDGDGEGHAAAWAEWEAQRADLRAVLVAFERMISAAEGTFAQAVAVLTRRKLARMVE